jgi:ribosome-binding protein aMBF1 (putative translation factor)
VTSVNPITEAIAGAIARKGRGAKATLAQDADVTMSTVTRWASGQILPSRTKWSAIERSLGMRAGTLETAHMASITPRDESSDLPAAVADAIQRLGASIEQLRSEVDELRSAIRQPPPPSGLASPKSSPKKPRPR